MGARGAAGDLEFGERPRAGYAQFDDEPGERDDEHLAVSVSFNTGAGSSPGDASPLRPPDVLLGGREPLARMLVNWRDEDESGVPGGLGVLGAAAGASGLGGAGAAPADAGRGDAGGGGAGTGAGVLGAGGGGAQQGGGGPDAMPELAAPSVYGLLRAFLRGLVFPLAIGQQLGRVPFLASFGPWALALALPLVFVLSAPHGPASVSAVEGFGPMVLILASTHLAALGDDYAGAALVQLRGLHAMSGLSLTLPTGRTRPADQLAADLRARASRWKSSRLFSWPFGALCLALGAFHAALPALQRSWLREPLLGAERDGRTTAACACISVGGFLASAILFATFVFFGRFYLLGLGELARRWAVFARLTPCLWPSELAAAERDLSVPPASLLENGLTWVRIRALLRADALDVSVSSQLYFGCALGLLAVQWLYLAPRLLARGDSLGLQLLYAHGSGARALALGAAHAARGVRDADDGAALASRPAGADARAEGDVSAAAAAIDLAAGGPSAEAVWLSLFALVAAFDAFVAVPILVSSFFAAYRVNQLQRAQTQAVRRVRQYVTLLVAHGVEGQHIAAAAARAAAAWPDGAGGARPAPGGARGAGGNAGCNAPGASPCSASFPDSYGASLDGAGASAARVGMSAEAVAVYRAYADFLGATVDAMAHEERDASVAGVPVGSATMRIVLVLGAAGFFAALYYLSLNTISFSVDEAATGIMAPAAGG
ncbi:hypothetical protein KFE25_005215 [Diacronema lutheri]|uniref:Uncharacterized protein n=1 Tax=Diacronema lutheri TaxID=2081491 RepID=A0A8J5X8U2_DIALT|nr:hypothetical protein KFE25_005215 [Diacronema lutheri]